MRKVIKEFIVPGKVNMIIDGGFGSSGKGTIASRISMDNQIDIACASLSPNAGHTFYVDGTKHITKLLPVSGILHDKSTIYLTAETVIDKELLFKELNMFNIDDSRLVIHPRAAVISEQNKKEELKDRGIETIASTQSGTGSARTSKIMREPELVENDPELKQYINSKFDLSYYLDQNLNILVETGQGVGLGLNHGYSYPYCTSRDVLPSNILGDLGLHPSYIGDVMLTFRTFPIRVGNIIRDNKEVGYSGPFYPDSKEITFGDLNVSEEYTTVTKRMRRIATFSSRQYEEVIKLVKPTHIFLNFINYFYNGKFEIPEFKTKPTYVGNGCLPEDVYEYDDEIIERIFK